MLHSGKTMYGISDNLMAGLPFNMCNQPKPTIVFFLCLLIEHFFASYLVYWAPQKRAQKERFGSKYVGKFMGAQSGDVVFA